MVLRLVIATAALITSANGLSTPVVETPSASASYGVGKDGFKSYQAQLPKDFDVVKEGGWHSLQKRYVSEVGKSNLNKNKSVLPSDLDVVSVGGYNNLEKLAADPKAELVTLIVNNLRSTKGSGDYTETGKIDALIALLQSQSKGFSSVTVDGEWSAVFQRQGKKSTKSQKFVGKRSKAASSLSNFSVKTMEFVNLVKTPRGNGLLKAVVKYNPVASNFDKDANGKIILRRISCDITDASFKYRSLPKISFPFLKRSGGYLDFLYLDDDIRITRGNSGGLFVHFRPEYLEKALE